MANRGTNLLSVWKMFKKTQPVAVFFQIAGRRRPLNPLVGLRLCYVIVSICTFLAQPSPAICGPLHIVDFRRPYKR